MQDVKARAAYPVDYERVALTKGEPLTDLHISGYVRGHRDYLFSAKAYDRASEFGIENGRISKLTVWHRGEEIMNYSRGWDTPPGTAEHREVLTKIVAAFPEPTMQQYRDFKRLQRDRLAERDETPRPRRKRERDAERGR